MRGSTVFQVQTVFQAINEIGTSKHGAKLEARENGAATWHEIGKELGIHSYATADAYRAVWRNALDYTKAEFGVKDIEKLTGEHLREFLEVKIEDGVAHATFSQYAAALEKLEVALNRYAEQNGTGQEYNFSEGIVEARAAGSGLERFEGTRAYSNPEQLVEAVRGDGFRLAAAIQQESGARVSEVNHLTESKLKGFQPDPQTGEVKGWIRIEGKGGKPRELGINPDTYAKLEKAVEKGQRFEFNGNAYRHELKAAAEATGQKYQGSHGLRWSWAQDRHAELQKNGKTYEQTIGRVSREMGHERADITEHYLR